MPPEPSPLDVPPGPLAELLARLRALWREQRRTVAQRWKRSLPFGDYVVDRWEKARELGFGDGASIYDSALVLGDVKVGRETWIGPGVVLDGSGGLTIGDHCSISAGVQIYTHDSVAWALSGGKVAPTHASTRIASRCYLGPHTVVAKGVEIGEGCVIGAHSLVLENIPAGSKAYGVPCRVVGTAVPGELT
jgi:acetyltransferase-like isoleucine patch superfamily enzyme